MHGSEPAMREHDNRGVDRRLFHRQGSHGGPGGWPGPNGASTATNVQSSGNCSYNLLAGSINGQTADPQFTALPPGNPSTLQDSINANFALKAGSPCAGIWSSITSVAQLLS
jgi:hypothetical protein